LKTHIFTVRVDFFDGEEKYGEEEVEVRLDDETVRLLGNTRTGVLAYRIAYSETLYSVYADDRIDYHRHCFITKHVTEEQIAGETVIDEQPDMSLVKE
jgi:hypothetical protein